MGVLGAASHQAGWTPLHRAAQSGKKECVRLLLESHANMEAENDVRPLPPPPRPSPPRSYWVERDVYACAASHQIGGTPLHVAAEHGKEECVALLLEAGANKEATNRVRPPIPLLLATLPPGARGRVCSGGLTGVLCAVRQDKKTPADLARQNRRFYAVVELLSSWDPQATASLDCPPLRPHPACPTTRDLCTKPLPLT